MAFRCILSVTSLLGNFNLVPPMLDITVLLGEKKKRGGGGFQVLPCYQFHAGVLFFSDCGVISTDFGACGQPKVDSVFMVSWEFHKVLYAYWWWLMGNNAFKSTLKTILIVNVKCAFASAVKQWVCMWSFQQPKKNGWSAFCVRLRFMHGMLLLQNDNIRFCLFAYPSQGG